MKKRGGKKGTDKKITAKGVETDIQKGRQH